MELLHALAETFEECGLASYPILALGTMLAPATIALPLIALVALRKTELVFGMVLAAGGLLVVALGLLGQQAGMAKVHEAIRLVEEADKARLLAAGTSEAHMCVVIGLGVGTWPAAVGVGLACIGIASARGAGTARKALAGISFGLALAALGTGLLNHHLGHAKAEAAVASVEPADQPRIIAAGEAMASRLNTGIIAGIALGAIGAAALLVRRKP